ncbi:hypothetical protein A6A03_07705 [Chloroflexus islandicus]|uniref:Uncharacterized protein n=1 Tax=Chloroflexus islandicus TaxID=1707952 RepID=A0A178MIC2_9CHLR|nr:hypothetical protein A6A03_07705 [Chloroflexus islandicus]
MGANFTAESAEAAEGRSILSLRGRAAPAAISRFSGTAYLKGVTSPPPLGEGLGVGANFTAESTEAAEGRSILSLRGRASPAAISRFSGTAYLKGVTSPPPAGEGLGVGANFTAEGAEDAEVGSILSLSGRAAPAAISRFSGTAYLKGVTSPPPAGEGLGVGANFTAEGAEDAEVGSILSLSGRAAPAAISRFSAVHA